MDQRKHHILRNPTYLPPHKFIPCQLHSTNAFQQELSRIQKFYLTWSGRLAAYKMLILPKLIYYFRALPIPLPTSFFTTMQKQLSRFVWVGKRARCLPHIQSKHKSVGGMSLPVLKDYYIAAILDQLKNWFAKPITKPWCQIELAWLNRKSPLSLLMASNLPKDSDLAEHPTIQATRLDRTKPNGKRILLNNQCPYPSRHPTVDNP